MTETGPAETSPGEISAVRTGRKTRQRPGQDRRQALVEAAYRRIAECGFEGLRLRDVAAEVGIDHSTIHHYFPTKQALVTAVVDYATRQFWTSEPRAEAAADELRRQLTRPTGAPAGAWVPAVDPAVAGELVIAAVKGASLDPEHAVGALRQLELLLIRD